MKHTVIVLLSCLLFIQCKKEVKTTETNQQEITKSIDIDDFVGVWKYIENPNKEDIPYGVYTIEIEKKDSKLIGKYCAIAQSGNRIDCSTENEYNLDITYNNDYLSIDFYSFFGAKKGKAKINLNNDTLFWEVTKEPVEGDFYMPNTGKFTNKIYQEKELKSLNDRSLGNLLKNLNTLKTPFFSNNLKNSKEINDSFFHFEKGNSYFELEKLVCYGYFENDNNIFIVYGFDLIGEGEGFAYDMIILSTYTKNGIHKSDIILKGDYGNEGYADVYLNSLVSDNKVVTSYNKEYYGSDTGLDFPIKIFKEKTFIMSSESEYLLSKDTYSCEKIGSLEEYRNNIEVAAENNNGDLLYGLSYKIENYLECYPVSEENIETYNKIANIYKGNKDKSNLILDSIKLFTEEN